MDYSNWYRRITQPFRERACARALGTIDKAFVMGFVAAYAILLIALLAMGNVRLLGAIAIPGITFALTNIIRLTVNRPRPYEAYDIEPLIYKDTRGKSMPSLHMASATIITFTFFQFWPIGGIALAVACAGIAFTRIVGGVHYPSDIVVSLVIAAVCGTIGFSLL